MSTSLALQDVTGHCKTTHSPAAGLRRPFPVIAGHSYRRWQTQSLSWTAHQCSQRAVHLCKAASPEVEQAPAESLQPPRPASAEEQAAAVEHAQPTTSGGGGSVEESRPDGKPVKREVTQAELDRQWQQAADMMAKGRKITGVIYTVNKGGCKVRWGSLPAFVPFKNMDPRRLPTGYQDELPTQLRGESVTGTIVSVDQNSNKLVLSERATVLKELLAELRDGDVYDGIVTRTTDYGAFVALVNPDGTLQGLQGLVHNSELSWDKVTDADRVVGPGQKVRVMVLKRNIKNQQLGLSMKRLKVDPLQENLDTVMPLNGDSEGAEVLQVPTQIPQGVEEVCRALESEASIQAVNLGRQTMNRVVSQDLELWISKEVVEDGFNLVARAGRVAQEMHIVTQMSKDEMTDTVQRVLKRLV